MTGTYICHFEVTTIVTDAEPLSLYFCAHQGLKFLEKMLWRDFVFSTRGVGLTAEGIPLALSIFRVESLYLSFISFCGFQIIRICTEEGSLVDLCVVLVLLLLKFIVSL